MFAKRGHAAGNAEVRFLKPLTWSRFLLLHLLLSSMSQSSTFSAPSDLAVRLRYDTDRATALSRRDSLAAAATDAASAHAWIMGLGADVVRSTFSSLFFLLDFLVRLFSDGPLFLQGSTRTRSSWSWSARPTTLSSASRLLSGSGTFPG